MSEEKNDFLNFSSISEVIVEGNSSDSDKELERSLPGSDPSAPISLQLLVPRPLNPLWAESEEHNWFVDVYSYTQTQTLCLPALCSSNATDLFYFLRASLRELGLWDEKNQRPLNMDLEIDKAIDGFLERTTDL